MSDFIMLPRSWLNPKIINDSDFMKMALYLAEQISENGSVNFSSGDAQTLFKVSRRRYRSFMSVICSGQQTTSKATNKTTNISFGSQTITATKRPAKRPTKRPTNDQHKEVPTYVLPSYVEPEFAEIWKKFIEYRKEIKKPYKSESSERIAYNKMVEMSEHDPQKAKDMVERTILGQWQGLYPNQSNGTKQSCSPNSTKASRDRLRCLASQIVSRSDNLLNLYNGESADPNHSEYKE